MAQNYGPKQANWVARFSSACVAFMVQTDDLQALCNEFTQNFYGTGGANAITDAVVQTGNPTGNGPLPAATAAEVNSAEAALAGANAILATISSNRGYLENMRP